jgi:hypothetical protein
MLHRAAAFLALLAVACGGAPRGDCDPDPAPGVVGSVCGFRNPEDVEYVASASLLLVSGRRDGEQPGSLSILPLRPDGRPDGAPQPAWPREEQDSTGEPAALGECSGPPAFFSPHGIDAGTRRADGSVPLAVVHHGERESVELFDLTGRGAAAQLRWRGCVRLPEGTTGNDVGLAIDGSLFVTNYQPVSGGLHGFTYTVRGALGFATGDVLAWHPDEGWQQLPGTRGAHPNGITLAPDGQRVFFAEMNAGAVRESPTDVALAEQSEAGAITIGGRPDNLSWSSQGSLLAAVHLAGPGVLACLWGRLPCRTAWALIEVEPDLSSAVELLRHDGEAVGGVSSAAEVAGRFYLGAIRDDRIGVWEPPE